MVVPCYQEIFVKNLYKDAKKDELLAKYLPKRYSCQGDCLNAYSSSGHCARSAYNI
jgi:hypothetical protein